MTYSIVPFNSQKRCKRTICFPKDACPFDSSDFYQSAASLHAFLSSAFSVPVAFTTTSSCAPDSHPAVYPLGGPTSTFAVFLQAFYLLPVCSKTTKVAFKEKKK